MVEVGHHASETTSSGEPFTFYSESQKRRSLIHPSGLRTRPMIPPFCSVSSYSDLFRIMLKILSCKVNMLHVAWCSTILTMHTIQFLVPSSVTCPVIPVSKTRVKWRKPVNRCEMDTNVNDLLQSIKGWIGCNSSSQHFHDLVFSFLQWICISELCFIPYKRRNEPCFNSDCRHCVA